ncbi:MAG TPA: LysR family transcriptional regulator [Anaerolineae bacterium]|nr:MAG: D-alanyl-D-alanine endopeptidase [Burkholderiales bacterium GWA2_64_37]OGB22706.1 MAG: D-alanyl-D-alanine endopeptidase [Burkholderiales bacterium RIFCSPHIGHO2_12_FULL_65_48]OGB53548.1 MAG: D-alanyl-D-alanine endopeptidase [Burkholderiales bacterium RIFCSPLOWO2_12_FULL_64_33]OGB78689.1 MAG: D-alanyl-D-alanine endopeptidase [Burkholderiales bacterium RIFOXYC12_FULL_60_6]OGI54477.1 MAG: D-alanyl-D-alanine endopeptidase [Candidatus Muproteobacteria bacterium RIFCSPHIGHO2_02_FULL_60_13]HKZ
MELRHLRYFIAVAEELHFARAAERLHIEQSPLSRAIKDLEYDLGVQLFERTTRSTRLTWAGQVFLDEARRVLSTLEQAKASAKAAATGYRGTLRIALSDGIAPPRLAALLAQNREEEPEVEIRLFETTLAQQLKGLCSGLYDAGFAHAAEVGEDIIAEPVWTDPLVIAVPARHPLLAHKRIPLEELIRYPLVLCHPEACEGCHRQLERILRTANVEPIVAEHVTTFNLMMILVAAGYGLGFANESQMTVCRHPEVVARPLAGRALMLSTYLLRPNTESSEPLSRFIARALETTVSPAITK